jgi:rhodanese-related sulfurtransferase
MSYEKITPKELFKKMQGDEKIIMLDVRAEDKFKDFHIVDPQVEVLNLPKTVIFEDEEKVSSTLPKDKNMIVTCTTGNSAAKCADILNRLGYKVTILEGGLTAWKEYRKAD